MRPAYTRRSIWRTRGMTWGTVRSWLLRDVIPELKEMKLTGHIFVKNARFSNKFQAKGSCNLYGLDGLAQAIVNINQGAMMCEADGIDEIVVRQFIESDRRNTPCIYEGLPLRSEFRVFYDSTKAGRCSWRTTGTPTMCSRICTRPPTGLSLNTKGDAWRRPSRRTESGYRRWWKPP